MEWLLRAALASFVRHGSLRCTTANGSILNFGDGSGPAIAVRFATRMVEWDIVFDPELKFGEAYVDGSLIIEEGSLDELLALISNQYYGGRRWTGTRWLLRYLWRRLSQFNRPDISKKNVAHHYDLDGRLYSLFLDADRQYSCAYFERPAQLLDEAQLAKKRHLAAKLLISPGQHVLDIGSGWGGLGLYLAEFCKAHVTGVTLSEEQLSWATARICESNVATNVEFRLQDYRDIKGEFDRIVSVGMFEHVGVGFYDVFFRKCASLLTNDGVFVLHAIGRSEGPGVTNRWIAKYIFPGGYIPALSEVLPAIERSGLLITDIEILRLHYAETLRAWRVRFLAMREAAEQLYDARFCRIWEFYLACAEASFRCERSAMMVFQIQLTKRQGIVPITRDYIGIREERLRAAETKDLPFLRLAGE